MGKQIIIIGATGSFNPTHLADIVRLLCANGLNVQHASTSEGTSTSFFTGTHEDLRKDLALLGHKIEVTTKFSGEEKTGGTGETAPGAVTLEVVNANVLKVLALVQPGTLAAPAVGEPSRKKKKGGGEEKPVLLVNEPPKDAHLDADGKPAVPGQVPEGALPLPGSTGAADGDNQEQQGTTTADDAGDEGTTATETTEKNNEEDAEG